MFYIMSERSDSDLEDIILLRFDDVGDNIIDKIDETNENKTDIKRLKQECRTGCNNDIKDRLEDLDLRTIKILKTLKDFKKELPKRANLIFKKQDLYNFEDWVYHYEKKIHGEEKTYHTKYDEMSQINCPSTR